MVPHPRRRSRARATVGSTRDSVARAAVAVGLRRQGGVASSARAEWADWLVGVKHAELYCYTSVYGRARARRLLRSAGRRQRRAARRKGTPRRLHATQWKEPQRHDRHKDPPWTVHTTSKGHTRTTWSGQTHGRHARKGSWFGLGPWGMSSIEFGCRGVCAPASQPYPSVRAWRSCTTSMAKHEPARPSGGCVCERTHSTATARGSKGHHCGPFGGGCGTVVACERPCNASARSKGQPPRRTDAGGGGPSAAADGMAYCGTAE